MLVTPATNQKNPKYIQIKLTISRKHEISKK